MRRFLKHCQGSTAIEFAICGPILLLFVIGVFEFGRFYLIRNDMRFAVGETGRYAMLNPAMSNATLEDYAEEQLFTSPESVTIAVTDEAINGRNYTTITMGYVFTFTAATLLNLDPIPLSVISRVPEL